MPAIGSREFANKNYSLHDPFAVAVYNGSIVGHISRRISAMLHFPW